MEKGIESLYVASPICISRTNPLFLFWRLNMVNQKRIIGKLPSLLVSGKTTSKSKHAEYKRLERGLRRLRRKNPEKFNTLTNEYVSAVQQIEAAVNS
jgi:hypothetical protein